MKLRMLACVLALPLIVAACGGGGSSDDATPVPTQAEEATTTPSPTPERASVTGPVAAGKLLASSDGKLEVAGSGRALLDVTIRVLGSDAPAAPRGWTLLSPVYDITARDTGQRSVTKLDDPFSLRFRRTEAFASVIYYDGSTWVLVPSTILENGIEAQTDHLTPFALARPANLAPTPTPSPSPTATPSPTTETDGTPAASRTPKVTVTATPISPEVAKAALEAAIQKYRGKPAKVAGASGYAGTAALALPEPLADALGGADALGEVYYGVYNGVNEAFVSGAAAGGVSGSFTLLVEPKTAFPSSSSQAQQWLAEDFPGATGQTFVAVKQSSTMYTFQAATSDGFVVLGFVEYQGVSLAFLTAGSGAYVGPAVDAKE